MSKLTIIRGLPGAGKSTFAREHYLDAVLVEADMFRMTPEGYKYDRNFNRHAHRWAYYTASKFLYGGIDVVICGVYHKLSQLFPYYDLVEMHKATLEVHTLSTQFTSVHNVPEYEMERLRREWQEVPESMRVFIPKESVE